jgi:tetratricopeptide (TPR) repeat protein
LENRNNISQEELERIEAYLMGQMDQVEKSSFERELEYDQQLGLKVNTVKEIVLGIEKTILKEEMDKFHGEINQVANPVSETPVRKINRWFFFEIAASISILFLIGLLIYRGGHDLETDLFAQYYEPDPGLITAMSSEGNYEFDRAMVDYKSGKYQDAIERWNVLLEQKSDNDTLQYFIGSAHLALKDMQQAQYYLKNVVEFPEGRFYQDAYWYLALSYLSEGDREKAKLFLEITDHPDKTALLEDLLKK